MNSNELFEEFLKYCNNYEYDLTSIVIKSKDICLKIEKPESPEKNYFLIYEIRKGNIREAGFISDFEELLQLCRDTIGEDSVIKSNSNGYGYM